MSGLETQACRAQAQKVVKKMDLASVLNNPLLVQGVFMSHRGLALRALSLSGLLLGGSALAAPCSSPVSPAAIDELVAKVDVAFVASETESIPPLANELRDNLPCVDGALDGRQVGGVHRVLAFDAFIGRRREETQASFAALRSADPEYALPEFLPGAHPLRVDFVAIDLKEAPTSPLPQPLSGRLWVNGKVSERRPDLWPALVQWEKGRGKIGLTALAAPGQPPPLYPVAEAVAANGGEKPPRHTKEPKTPKEPKEPKGPDEQKGPRWAFVAAGGGALAVSGALGLWASSAGQDWAGCVGADLGGCLEANTDAAKAAWAGKTAWGDLSASEQKTNTLLYGADQAYAKNHLAGGLSLGAAALGAGLITVGFVW